MMIHLTQKVLTLVAFKKETHLTMMLDPTVKVIQKIKSTQVKILKDGVLTKIIYLKNRICK